MLPWQPKFYQDQTFFLYNFLFLEFQWIRFSNYRVVVNLITQWSTCKPDDVIIFTVVVVCSEPILSVVFRLFKRRYLWNQIRYKKTVNSVHSCFSCIFIWENKNFRFISTLSLHVSMHARWNISHVEFYSNLTMAKERGDIFQHSTKRWTTAIRSCPKKESKM